MIIKIEQLEKQAKRLENKILRLKRKGNEEKLMDALAKGTYRADVLEYRRLTKLVEQSQTFLKQFENGGND